MWNIIGVYNYVLYTNNVGFLEKNWPKFIKAMDFVTNKTNTKTGLMNVTGTRDWARWNQGGENSAANML
jgi:uncharacterized protein (DUF608 family)